MNPRRHAAFTLIELLTTIAIIVILIGLLFPAVQFALRRADITNANRMVTGLHHAFSVYYHEQSKWPDSTWTSTDATTVNFLTGGNTQKVQYMELLPKHLDSSGQLRDPWGNLYQLKFANNYPPSVSTPAEGSGSVTINAGCIVWSKGPDGVSNTSDDIRSW